MTIKDYQRLSFFHNIDPSIVDEIKDEPYVRSDSDMIRVLSEIYSVDPISGLPKGDLQYYLSSDGNPEIKAWLENNLLAPRAAVSGNTIEGLTDSMIAEMSRLPDESNEMYASRLSSIRDAAIADIEKFKNSGNKE